MGNTIRPGYRKVNGAETAISIKKVGMIHDNRPKRVKSKIDIVVRKK